MQFDTGRPWAYGLVGKRQPCDSHVWLGLLRFLDIDVSQLAWTSGP